jgi:NTP pyrophosphatase (non-canonical NTP hydrolase)
LDRDKIIDEAGDCLWYLAAIASGLGVGLGEIAEGNVEKLRKRYPEGFEAHRSVNRQ